MLTATSACIIIDSGISPMSGLAITVGLSVELPSDILKTAETKNPKNLVTQLFLMLKGNNSFPSYLKSLRILSHASAMRSLGCVKVIRT